MVQIDKKQTIEEVFLALSNAETINAQKSYLLLKPILSKKVSDVQLNQFMDLIRLKLGDSKFDLFLLFSGSFTQRQMRKENRDQLINRLYMPIKIEVRELLHNISAEIVASLDLLTNNTNNEIITKWLISASVREDFIFRAKLCYLYVVLKLDNRYTLDFELLLLCAIENDAGLNFDKYIGKLIPDILLSSNPFIQVQKLAYFHYSSEKAARNFGLQLAELQLKYNAAISDNQRFQNDLASLRDQFNIQQALTDDRDREVSTLNSQVKKLEDRLEFEVHKAISDNRSFQILFVEDLLRKLRIEIDGINTTLSHVDEPIKSRLKRRLSNVESILNKEINRNGEDRD